MDNNGYRDEFDVDAQKAENEAQFTPSQLIASGDIDEAYDKISKENDVLKSNMAVLDASLLIAMKDLCGNADDTVWITGTETMFDRLARLYLLAGGSEKKLAEWWPEVF